MRTKWEILQARAERLRKELEALEAEMKSLKRTKFGSDCTICGTYLKTEKDFADHFLVGDERYLNLGDCKNKSPL